MPFAQVQCTRKLQLPLPYISGVDPSLEQPPPGINISDLEIHSPLILKETPQQLLVTATKDHGSSVVGIQFALSGKDDIFAQYVVHYEQRDDWRSEWADLGYLTQSRVHTLMNRHKAGESVDRRFRNITYGIFSRLVAYSAPYQGM